MVRKCLLFIAYAEPELTILKLRQAVSTPDALGAHLDEGNTISEQEISRRCSSLIRKTEDGLYFEFAHFSVQEFLEDMTALQPRLKAYFINRQIGLRTLATQCLRFLQLENFDQRPTSQEQAMSLANVRDENFPFYKDAAKRWLNLMNDDLSYNDEVRDENELLTLMRSLFHPKKTSRFIMWALHITYDFFSTATYWSRQSPLFEHPFSRTWDTVSDNMFRPLHLAAALNIPEMCSYLLDHNVPSDFQLQILTPFDLAVLTMMELPRLRILKDFFPFGILDFYQKRRSSSYKVSTARRNSTIDLFVEKDAAMSNYHLLPDDLSVFSLACIMALYSSDLSPVVKLLSFGTIPSPSEIDTFQQVCQTFENRYIRNADESTFEGSSLALLMHLKGTFSSETDWEFWISSTMWNKALELGLSYTRDPLLLDSRITMSQEALTTRTLRAIDQNNVGTLEECLADGRLNLADMHEYDDPHIIRRSLGTLLHVAVSTSEPSVVNRLLDAGCDPYKEDKAGRVPLHCLDYRFGSHNFEIITLFSKRGISLLSTDAEGHTIWHTWARSKNNFDWERESDGVGFLDKMYSLDCEATEKALLTTTHHGDTPLLLALKRNYFEEARMITVVSSKFQGFWKRHPPVLGAAAQGGSVELVRQLLDAGAQKEPGEPGTCTPLHQLGLTASLKCFNLLQSLYPEAIDYQFEGCAPIEFYMQRALRDHICPRVETMGAMIQSTKLWSGPRKSPVTVRLLKELIGYSEFEIISLLLEKGVDVHQRVDGVSIIEYSCDAEQAVSLSSTNEGREMFTGLLDHSNKPGLNETALAGPGKGLGLLHTLAVRPESDSIPWLIKELVARDVNLNTQAGEFRDTPLAYHLERNCSRYSEVLLDLGADPTIVSSDKWGPVQLAVYRRNAKFLKKLLEYVTKRGISMPWKKSYQIKKSSAGNPGGRRTVFEANHLHLASSKGSVACLSFFLDEHLLTDLNVRSAEGYTPLHFAAICDDGPHLDVMRFLFSKGADLRAVSSDGSTPLHIAARNGFLSGTKFLLENGAVESFNIYGKSPTCYAIQQGHESVVQCLEAARTSGECQPLAFKHEMPLKKRVKFLAKAFKDAIISDDLGKCKTLVAQGCPVDVEMPTCGGCSQLLTALRQKKAAIATWLLQKGASATSSTCGGRHSTIEIAAAIPALNSALSLLLMTYVSQGGDLVRGEDYPFHIAIDAGNVEGIELLLRGLVDHASSIA